MDNPYYGWSPIVDRPPLRLPGGARVAVVVIVNVEQAEWLPPPGTLIPPSAVRFGPYPEIFDVHDLSLRAYGNRVGVFRVMDALARCGIRGTAAVDALFVRASPTLVARLVERDWEPIGHGLSFSRLLSEELSEVEERATIQESLDVLERAWGASARGVARSRLRGVVAHRPPARRARRPLRLRLAKRRAAVRDDGADRGR